MFGKLVFSAGTSGKAPHISFPPSHSTAYYTVTTYTDGRDTFSDDFWVFEPYFAVSVCLFQKMPLLEISIIAKKSSSLGFSFVHDQYGPVKEQI